MSKLVVAGCSLSSGTGFDPDNPFVDCLDAPELWVNLCAKNIDALSSLELINVSQRGASNTIIFENAVKEIGKHGNNIDTMFCQWTAMPRYQFSVGLEFWSTNESLVPRQRSKEDVSLVNGIKIKRSYLDNLLNQLNALHHLHSEILKVVKYTNILKNLAAKNNIKIYFINGICPWDKDYFKKLSSPNITPKDLTDFTKTKILNIEHRSDEDIFKLYNIIHEDYDREGGIDPRDWINLYDSMGRNKKDLNADNEHPGIISNQYYFDQINNFLKSH